MFLRTAESTRRHAPAGMHAMPAAASHGTHAPSRSADACACGGSCPRCAGIPLQRKASVSSAGDASEHEADRMADHVMRSPGGASPGAIGATGTAGSAGIEREAATVAEAEASSGGAPLPRELRAFYEPRFGQDFSGVRLHTGSVAAHAVQARAYTFGSHIVFAPGEYGPASSRGAHLLAHELAHVVQQGHGHAGAASTQARRIDRQEMSPAEVCRMREPLYGWDNIRNRSREQLRAAGFVFCGPDHFMGARHWERWVHPTRGVLHFQVSWPDSPEPEPRPPEPAPDDRQRRCADPCMAESDDEESCHECCDDTIDEADGPCRRTCHVACGLML
ncbi:eCIS core domain-containing protein [Pseudoduganella albidiflava]|uniref:DUF4157 domain-containing protein n=1 Tax=Pseudoduganella albidiflava TaxID=321983 RepID=A0A411WV03_9BURK|nr:DUF4157 domain-containing protein [Pseudoduganella albidiflava]QBI00459.1 DUF4157 domain-containing protein [Pseudoduganella albidiflava]GGY33149.1 hypothetical protein GCM10007387_14290 [Pseudoduganella albidiflava]